MWAALALAAVAVCATALPAAAAETREGASDAYVMSASGGPATRLTSSPFDGQSVAWNEAGTSTCQF